MMKASNARSVSKNAASSAHFNIARAVEAQRLAQVTVMHPRDARCAQLTRPAAARAHIVHSRTGSRAERPVQIDVTNHSSPETHLTRRTLRAGDPDRTRPTLWPSVAKTGPTTPVSPRGTRVPHRPGPDPAARCRRPRPVAALRTPVSPTAARCTHRPGLTWCALDAGIATNAGPTLRPGVADKAGGALHAGLTARPGVPDRPGLTWCADPVSPRAP